MTAQKWGRTPLIPFAITVYLTYTFDPKPYSKVMVGASQAVKLAPFGLGGFRVKGLEFKVQGLGPSLGFRVLGFTA